VRRDVRLRGRGTGPAGVVRRLPSRMFLVSEPGQGGREAPGGRVCGGWPGGQRGGGSAGAGGAGIGAGRAGVRAGRGGWPVVR
jgi:hypothetical protein